MKPTILIYCGEDGEAAKALAASLRDGKSHVVMCAASAFSGVQRHGDRIEFTNDVPQRLRDAITAAHGLPAELHGSSFAQHASYELQGSGYDPCAVGYELQGRALEPEESAPAKRPRGRPRKIAA